jgi:tetratricopeptide (TPR) repeat protein
LLGLAAFALFALLAPAGPYWLDSGELASAAWGLGSPHPTGFPLFCVLARLAALVPVGEIALRINLLSAGWGALAVWAVARLVLEASPRDVAAVLGSVAAALTLALSLTFLRQATVCEVYAPTAALLLCTARALHRAAQRRDARSGLVLAMLCGTGLATHTSFALLVGLPAAGFALVQLRRGARWPRIAPVLVVLGVALYAYLPVRSATGRTAAVDWGHPRSLEALWAHLSGQRIRQAFADEMWSRQVAVVADNARAFALELGDQLGPVALLAALGGLAWLATRRGCRWLAALLLAVVLLDGAYAVWINPMGIADLQNGVPLLVALCAAAGLGAAWLARQTGRATPYAGAVLALLVAAPAALVSLPEVGAAAPGQLPRTWAEAAFAASAVGSAALVQNDSTMATMMFLSLVEGSRPDVAVLARQHLVRDPARSRAVLARSGRAIAGTGEAGAALLPALLAGPLTWEIGPDAPPRSHVLRAGAPLAEVVPAARAARDAGALADAAARLRALARSPEAGDRSAARTLANGFTHLARLALAQRQLDSAERLLDAAIAVDPGFARAWVNRGVVAAQRGQFAAALQFTGAAIARAPGHVGARLNQARFLQHEGRDREADQHIERALALAPGNADAWALAGIAAARRGDRAAARAHLARALALDPAQADAREALARLSRLP